MNFFLDSLLDLPDVRVRNVVQETGQVFLELACLREVATCPHCQNSSEEVNQSRPTLIRDLSIFGKPVYLKIPRRQFYCRHCQKYFTEQLSFVEDGRRYTRRYETEIYERVKATNVEQVSREEDLSWDRVQGIFEHQFEQKKKSWEGVKRLSLDEISCRKGQGKYVTVVSDLERGKLIEVMNTHQKDEIVEILEQQPIEVREKVEEVSVDMWRGFLEVVDKVFPNARIVIDRFHVMQKVNKELNKIRLQAKVNVKGSRGILLKNGEDLKTEEREKLEEILKQSKRLRKAYEYKEKLREIFERSKNPSQGRKRILRWLKKVSWVYGEVITTIKNHLEGICNYFLNRTTSGKMEGINNRLKLIKRQAYGFLNFKNMRARFLACFV